MLKLKLLSSQSLYSDSVFVQVYISVYFGLFVA